MPITKSHVEKKITTQESGGYHWASPALLRAGERLPPIEQLRVILIFVSLFYNKTALSSDGAALLT